MSIISRVAAMALNSASGVAGNCPAHDLNCRKLHAAIANAQQAQRLQFQSCAEAAKQRCMEYGRLVPQLGREAAWSTAMSSCSEGALVVRPETITCVCSAAAKGGAVANGMMSNLGGGGSPGVAGGGYSGGGQSYQPLVRRVVPAVVLEPSDEEPPPDIFPYPPSFRRKAQ